VFIQKMIIDPLQPLHEKDIKNNKKRRLCKAGASQLELQIGVLADPALAARGP